MNKLTLFILLIVLSFFAKSQNRNISFEIINKGLNFDSARIEIDSVVYHFSLKHSDTIFFSGFNPDTLTLKKVKLSLFKGGKTFNYHLIDSLNYALNLKIVFEACYLKWYEKLKHKKFRFRRKIYCDNMFVGYGVIGIATVIMFE